jgi:hypothetical protein
MPAIFAITKHAAEMQPDAIEASELGADSGVLCGAEFMAGRHNLFLFTLLLKLLAIAHIRSLRLIHGRVNSSTRSSMDGSLELGSRKHFWDENFGRGAHHTREKSTPLPAR